MVAYSKTTDSNVSNLKIGLIKHLIFQNDRENFIDA